MDEKSCYFVRLCESGNDRGYYDYDFGMDGFHNIMRWFEIPELKVKFAINYILNDKVFNCLLY